MQFHINTNDMFLKKVSYSFFYESFCTFILFAEMAIYAFVLLSQRYLLTYLTK